MTKKNYFSLSNIENIIYKIELNGDFQYKTIIIIYAKEY